MGRVHNRMPVILPQDRVDDWLYSRGADLEKLRRLLVPTAEDLLVTTPVSARVNNVKNDDPSVLENVAGVD